MKLGMNDCLETFFTACLGRIAGCDEHVLPIPDFNRGLIPDCPADCVRADESMRVEKCLPVAWPLTIYVVLPSLTRTRGGKDDLVGVTNETLDQQRAARLLQVLSHFQASTTSNFRCRSHGIVRSTT